MQPLPQSLAPWHDFYTLLGEASATMTGLLFVAASVGAAVFSQNRPGALRMFLSASVVQFASILSGSLIVLAPLQQWEQVGGMILACGVVGLLYSALAWRDARRDGLTARIDLEDRVWYALAPAAGYLVEAGAGFALILRSGAACAALAVAMGLLLLVAIHNAWDITVWSVTRRRD
ncbi:MAG TPA: hypothetical protein VHS58_10615 [Acetobacteraceae bacterium]|jgi:hypothetical protein|nr:hypothetical protein [Acetobacteraceae bacterium]